MSLVGLKLSEENVQFVLYTFWANDLGFVRTVMKGRNDGTTTQMLY